jgi:antitoxin ParD1/3/4
MDDIQDVNVALRDLTREEIERLRRLWDEGKASGDAGVVDFVELRREARERLLAAKEAVD